MEIIYNSKDAFGEFKDFKDLMSRGGLSKEEALEYIKLIKIPENPYLGVWEFPLYNFEKKCVELKTSNTQLDPWETAAIVYFGMLAEKPKPTAEQEVRHWGYIDALTENEILKIEEEAVEKRFLRWLYAKPAELVDPQEEYLKNISRLQKWIKNNGLWDGIQKTLNEQSRQRQKEAANAGYGAEVAQARRAAEIAELAEATTEEARAEAAESIGKSEMELEYNLKREKEIKDELANIEQGLPADFGKEEKPGISWPLVIAGGAVLLLLLRGRK